MQRVVSNTYAVKSTHTHIHTHTHTHTHERMFIQIFACVWKKKLNLCTEILYRYGTRIYTTRFPSQQDQTDIQFLYITA